MFFYQHFDFIQLMRGEPVISSERYGPNPEFRRIPSPDDMNVGGSFRSLL
jgi:hypothetical protein